jgi:hypothetical protein
MTRPSRILRNLSVALLAVILSQACMRVEPEATPAPLPAKESAATPTAPPTATPLPTQTEAPPTAFPAPRATLNVVKGNLFIRRGPDMAFNTIGTLYKDTSAKIIARDVLSNWVQIQIPKSKKTGWVSIQTEYSQIEGDIKSLPEITPTEWPRSAYLRNCTYHRMYVLPSEAIVPITLEYPDNEIWIYPGEYVVYDIDIPGDPEVMKISIKEGSDIEIIEDGQGNKRQCP